MNILSILLFIISLSIDFSSAQTIETDKQSLLAFKSQLNLNNPNSLSSWQQNSSSPCNWTGVSCTKDAGQRVVSLNLSSFGLSGTISPHIANLSFLTSLHLQNNQLSGTFPDQICNLFRLTVLNLSSNSFQGPLPSNISNLSDLQFLDLSMDMITGKIPQQVTFLTNLKVLNLGRNRFGGSIPASIGNLSSPESLILGTNSLTGAIPSDLSRLRALKILDFTINDLKGTLPSGIYNMSSLVDLAMASNQLWGEIPSDVGVTLPNLLVINLCFNMFTGGIPGSLHNLTNIRVIRMASNFLEGSVPPGLGNLAFLEMYNVGFNKIVSYGDNGLDFITSLTNNSRLQFLAVDANFLQGTIPESIGNLSKNLMKLYMGGNQISGQIPASIGNLSSLTLLNLSYNSITGPIPKEIGQLMNLQELSLAGNRISGKIPDSLGNLKRLNLIDLSRNDLAGKIPITFGNFQSLLSMDLSVNKLNGSIPKEILNLPSLSTILNLSNNFLTGNLADEIGLLESVVTIDLFNNFLSGIIPSSIRNCKSLERLYMAKNSFSGPLPASLGDLKGLEILDLSYNNLSGFIPDEIQTLQVLQSLNLSFNNLEGEVPCGGLFTNFSRVEFEGNPKLSVCSGNGGDKKKPVKVYIIISVVAIVLAICIIVVYILFVRRRKSKIAQSSSLMKEQHQMVSYQELRQGTGNFDEKNLIGKGSFGSVYKGLLGDGSAVAIKVFDVNRTGSLRSFAAECEALKSVRHRNLVKLITSCSSVDFRNREFLALVFELLSNGSLEDWINGKRTKEDGDALNLVERLNVAIDVAGAIDYLHNDCETPVVHCDLKPSNVLLNDDMTAKVGDFGLARLLIESTNDQISNSSTNVIKGTTGFIPPEYGLGVKPSTGGDVYSYGVMLLELFTGKSPTDDIFVGDMNLISWVKSGFHTNILQVVDPELVLLMENSNYDGNCEVSKIHYDCLMTVIEIGLSCSAESADGRISIRNALLKLQGARDELIKNIDNC
ncbi:putative receptor-like protein kinase At3g47110 [Euphorbia lathyris]|uniref:putative receptor-like protein kinase At3g47110 n=1 Tax=Euphorbia lathyris TaxID=212925 RepID=UPI0033139E6B